MQQEKRNLEAQLQQKNEEISVAKQKIKDLEQTVFSMQSVPDRLRGTSSVQAEELGSRSNKQQSSSRLQEITVANQKKEPVSSRLEGLNKKSITRDKKTKA